MRARIILAAAIVALAAFDNPFTFMEALAAQVQTDPVQEPAAPAPVDQEPVEEPQPVEQVEQVEQQPEPEPPEPVTLSDVYAALQAAITADAAHQVTVGASTDALEAARQALVDAEQAHAAAMEDQGEHNAGLRAAAQRFVDFLTAAYLSSPAVQ